MLHLLPLELQHFIVFELCWIVDWTAIFTVWPHLKITVTQTRTFNASKNWCLVKKGSRLIQCNKRISGKFLFSLLQPKYTHDSHILEVLLQNEDVIYGITIETFDHHPAFFRDYSVKFAEYRKTTMVGFPEYYGVHVIDSEQDWRKRNISSKFVFLKPLVARLLPCFYCERIDIKDLFDL